MAIYGKRADGSELKTQWETILYYLQSNPGKTISQWEATKEFGFTDLAGIVKKIHYRTGIFLNRKEVQVKTRYGGTTYITQYWFEK